MSSVYEKRGVWYIRYKDQNGTWVGRPSKAETKTAAKVEAQEAERLARRRRDGLESMPEDASLTLKDLCEWWLKNRCKPDRSYNERKRLQRHVLGASISALPLGKLRTAHIDDVLIQMDRDGLSASTINGLRALLRTIFSKAHKGGLWTGHDPLADVERRKVPRRIYATLSADEVPRVLEHVSEEWRLFFATALLTGMRKGELCGLRRSDIDLDAKLLTVARSYDKETTKGGHADIIPISEPLVPVLRLALDLSKREWVFPDSNGRMRTKEAGPQDILRRALARADIVEGYTHTCRRCKAKGHSYEESYADKAPRDCPKCGMRLWPTARPRPVRFHDLRHTTATLLLRAGVDMHRVQRILRHRDVKMTVGTYAHLQIDDLRAAVNVLPAMAVMADPVEPIPALSIVAEPVGDRFATRLLPAGSEKVRASDSGVENTLNQRPFSVGAARFELTTTCTPRGGKLRASACSRVQIAAVFRAIRHAAFMAHTRRTCSRVQPLAAGFLPPFYGFPQRPGGSGSCPGRG